MTFASVSCVALREASGLADRGFSGRVVQVARGERGGHGGDEWEDGDLEDVETLDEALEEDRRAGGAGRRWLLLLLVIPAVALVVLQLQPDRVPTPTLSPTPTRSATPTTSWGTWPAPSPSPVHAGPPVVRDVGHGLLGATGDWELFARAVDSVVRIQLASGRVTTTPVPALESNGSVAFIATDAGVIVHPQDGVRGYAVPDGKRARALSGALGNGGPVVPGPDPGHVWVDTGQGMAHGTIDLVGVDGRPAGPLFGKPRGTTGWMRADGGGYPMIATSGGIYDVHPGSLRRITAGTVEAVGPTGWLVVECDEENRCSRFVVDRGTGDRRTLPGEVTRYSPMEGRIAPDGSVAVLGGLERNNPRVWLLDLHTGRLRMVDVVPPGRTFLSPAQVAWSPDSRWVVLIDDRGDLVAIDAGTGTVRHLDLGLPELEQLRVRPRG